MKTKTYIAALLLAAACMLTASCSKDSVNDNAPQAQEPFHIFASISGLETKTINDGMSTRWLVGDRLNLHYAVSGTTDYVSAGRFDIKDASTGRAEIFNGTAPVLDGNTKYDWYAFCRYNSNNSPVKTKMAVYIGCKNTGTQTQNGNDNMAHIFGANSNNNFFPLYGCVKGVLGSEFPTIIMKNVASLAEYKVTNSLDKDITITGITLEGANPFVGSVYVNYEQEEAVVTPGITSNSAVLNVSEGTAIAPGASACFYAGVIPGEQASLTVTVNVKDADGTAGSQVFTLTPAEPVIFRSGKIKTLALPFSQAF